MEKFKPYTYLACISLIVCIFIFAQQIRHPSSNNVVIEGSASSTTTAENLFDSVSIEAKAAYVLDVTNGEILYQKNPDLSLPLASVTKLMTALVTLERTAGNAERYITIEKSDLAPEGDDGLLVGEKWNTNDLVAFTLMKSSNDGSAALARSTYGSTTIFIQKMNERAKEIGMNHTFFYNEHGLDITIAQAGAYGSVRDIARLMSAALFEKVDSFRQTALLEKKFKSNVAEHIAVNTNTIVGKLPNLIASKTGFTDLAGGNLVVAFNASLNHPVIISVLGSSRDGRFSDVLTLASTTLAQLQRRDIIKK